MLLTAHAAHLSNLQSWLRRCNILWDKRGVKRILAITNLETWIKKNKPKKCSVQYVLNCSYRLGRLKRQQASDKLRFLHRSYMRAKQNGGLLLREKQARQLSTCMTEQRCSHRWTIEPWNHWIMEPLNEKSQIDQECGLLPGISRQQTMTRTLILYVFCFVFMV